jgi:hypothetical protein
LKQVNKTLTYLNVSRNSLCKGSVSGAKRGQGGLVAIAKGLQKNSTLTEVDISNNLPDRDVFHTAGFGSQSCFAYAAALKENTTLVKLDLSSNHLNQSERKALTRAAKNSLELLLKDVAPEKDDDEDEEYS